MNRHRGKTRFVGLRRIAAVLLIIGSKVGSCVAGYMQEPPTLSPFTEVRHEADRVIVRVRGELYELVALDDIAATKILQSAKDQFGELWQKRFAEDLVKVLWGMGHRPGATVKLELRALDTNRLVTIPDAEMTEANRRQVWRVRHGDPIRQPSEKLSPQQALALIEEFKSVLRERWSYYAFSAATIEPAIASLAERAGELSTTPVLALELQKIVALGIDGHAEVSGWRLDDGFLPFLIEPSGDRFVAFSPGRDRFLADDLPFIVSIDGRPISEWCRAAETLVPKGSPGYVRRNALRQLRNIEHWRGELGLARGVPLQVELASADGSRSKTVSIPIDDNLQLYGVWPRLPSRVLPENVGYLRLESMDDAAVAEILEMMPRFRNTNGIGRRRPRQRRRLARTASLAVFVSSIRKRSAPRGQLRSATGYYEGFADDHLTSRFLYPANSSVWNENERAAIAEFQKIVSPRVAAA